ncbi:hypothetical protein Dxin01_00205 [Deinococcus xinjiangensis]|uniref:Uncharacterized protein n=1 Tax=Deinococcus xinjiangensis TaxID=457454 RepID=A0ABP9V5C1_9DEIO
MMLHEVVGLSLVLGWLLLAGLAWLGRPRK